MPFWVERIAIGQQEFNLSPESSLASNKITVVVGPNGAGKTRLLSALAYQFSNKTSRDSGEQDYPIASVGGQSPGRPTKVVAQTFSPFSRFPMERRVPIRLDEYLTSSDEDYAAIGFTRGSGLRGSVSRDAIGRITRKLLTNPEHASFLEAAMRALGFVPRIQLRYSDSTVAQNYNFKSGTPMERRLSVVVFLNDFKNRAKSSGEALKLSREINDDTAGKLADRILRSIDNIKKITETRDGSSGRGDSHYVLDFSLPISNSTDLLMQLEAIITLNRIGLLRLLDCNIFPERSSVRWDAMREGIDIADASSGEQQLLSSLFGIVAEAENDTLILIDEPELSLHPEWQTQFIDLLESVLSAFNGCHVFVATHSALVAQRALEKRLEILPLGRDELSVPRRSDINQFSVEQTLLEVFDLPVRDSIYVSRLLLALVMEAERDPIQMTSVRKRLNALKMSYEKSPIKDDKMEQLILDAFAIIEMPSSS